MKGPMQIKTGKCYSLMLFCLKIKCIKIRTTYSFPNISALHFTNVYNLLSCYYNGRIVICQYQGVTLRNNKLFWEVFVNISAVIRAMLWLLLWLKLNFCSINFKKNKYNMGAFWFCYLGYESPVLSNRVSKLH